MLQFRSPRKFEDRSESFPEGFLAEVLARIEKDAITEPAGFISDVGWPATPMPNKRCRSRGHSPDTEPTVTGIPGAPSITSEPPSLRSASCSNASNHDPPQPEHRSMSNPGGRVDQAANRTWDISAPSPGGAVVGAIARARRGLPSDVVQQTMTGARYRWNVGSGSP